MEQLKLLGFAGSLRKDSLNRKLLAATRALAPEGVEIDSFDIRGFPVYDGDLEEEAFPEQVSRFKEALEAADGVIIVTPEYNYSIAGSTKNALDWISRPYGKNSLYRKPVIIQSASPGFMGGARAQYHLRQVLGYLEAKQMQFPEVFLGGAHEKFDAEGNLTDERAITGISKQLSAFREFILHERR